MGRALGVGRSEVSAEAGSRLGAVHVSVVTAGDGSSWLVKALGVIGLGWGRVGSPATNRGAVLLRAFSRVSRVLRLFRFPSLPVT